jgi:hypothetical protein
MSESSLLALGFFIFVIFGSEHSTAKPKLPGPVPSFEPAGGIYTNQQLSIRIVAENGIVRYTLDGSAPTVDAPAFQDSLTITNTTLVRARAFSTNHAIGPIISQAYTFLADDLADFSSNLPLVIVDCYGEELSLAREQKITGNIRFIAPKGGRAHLTGMIDFAGRAHISVRGHSSRRYPKHSLNIKPIDEQDEKVKASMLGLPKQSEWVLYAPYPDKTLMRDVLSYELNQSMGHWAPRTRFVEVFINDTRNKLTMEDYAGVYVFEDKITRDKGRVELAKLSPVAAAEPEITGGYLFKKDHVGRGVVERARAENARLAAALPESNAEVLSGPGEFPADPAGFGTKTDAKKGEGRRSPRGRKPERVSRPVHMFTNYVGIASGLTGERTANASIDDDEVVPDEDGFWTEVEGNHFYYVEPEPDELTAVQRAWLKGYLNQFETALYGEDFKDPLHGYRAFIEPDSFIDYHLIMEVAKNVDAFRFSTYYQKDRSGLLKMEPIWDMNLTFGNANSREGYLPERWLWPQFDDQQYSWFRRLFEDSDYGQRYVDRWSELRTNVFATSNVVARVDRLAAELAEAQKRNFTRWPILGTTVVPNHFVGDSYEQEVRWMRDWITKRLDWLDAQFLHPPSLTLKPGASTQLTELATPNSAAQIYYTLDGTDPRQTGGGIAARARLYKEPISASKDNRLFARIKQDNRWSGPLRLQ